MVELIKELRVKLNMSQVDFAEKLGVTFATVNRWENGHTLPNRLAQDRIYALCREHGISLHDLVLKRIENEKRNIKPTKGRVLLYHGSKSGIVGGLEPKSRPQCDVGRGFCMGTEAAQALTLVCDYEEAKLYILSIDLEHLQSLEVPVTLDWAMIVAYNRGRLEKVKGTKLYEKYQNYAKEKDLVIGSIADDRMFFVIDNFFIGNITDAALINSLSALELGKQYVAITQKACDAVRIEKEIELSYLEKLAMKDAAAVNRERGAEMAKDVCANYRREGLFFDEILQKVSGGEGK